jgi:[ribosomal protein S5]-alanine N-acetyltransferase
MPTLATERLTLRPLSMSDAPTLQELLQAREIAENVLDVPHPYPDGEAERFIVMVDELTAQNFYEVFAIERCAEPGIIGTVWLEKEGVARVSIGYWLGKPYWGRGIMTEAVKRVVAYAFEALGCNRVYASVFPESIASARVAEKAGMVYEATMRQHIMNLGRLRDLAFYGMVRARYETLHE